MKNNSHCWAKNPASLVDELQCQVLKGQLEEQKLTKEKTILQIELIKQLSQDQGNGGLAGSQLALFAPLN
jgi:hypothetical protein